jgi:O-succinylbenzoate synthase
VSASKRYWKEDIIEPSVEVSSQGFIKVPTGPGRGFQIKTKFVDQLTTRKKELLASGSAQQRSAVSD